MKKISLFIALLSVCAANAQIKEVQKEAVTIAVLVDPKVVLEDDSRNLAFELEYISYNVYVRANIKSMPDFETGYFDWGGTIGTNLTNGKETVRYYGGLKIATAIIGGKHYALTGGEIGVDFYNCNKIFMGLRFSSDYLSHFTPVEESSRYINSASFRIGYKF
jgi:hypothetical protein